MYQITEPYFSEIVIYVGESQKDFDNSNNSESHWKKLFISSELRG